LLLIPRPTPVQSTRFFHTHGDACNLSVFVPTLSWLTNHYTSLYPVLTLSK
jgi:hypothetical protein